MRGFRFVIMERTVVTYYTDYTSINTTRAIKKLFWGILSPSELWEELFSKKNLITVYHDADSKSMDTSAELHRLTDLGISRDNDCILGSLPIGHSVHQITSELWSVKLAFQLKCIFQGKIKFLYEKQENLVIPFKTRIKTWKMNCNNLKFLDQ